MVGYLEDLSRFGGNNYGGVGALATPMVMGTSPAGASNPLGAAFQAASTPNVSGISGVGGGIDAWSGMRNPITPVGVGGAKTGGGVGGSGFGFNLDTAQMALGGLQTIGSLWQAWEANKLAKEQFKFQKDFAEQNLANQIQSYNTTLEDRTRARTHTEGASAESAQAYIDKHSLRKS